MDLQTRLNEALLTACSTDELKNVICLMNVGADPIYNEGSPLLHAIVWSSYPIVRVLLLLGSEYSNPSSKPIIQKAYKIAKSRETIDKTIPYIVEFIREHYKHCFKEDIELTNTNTNTNNNNSIKKHEETPNFVFTNIWQATLYRTDVITQPKYFYFRTKKDLDEFMSTQEKCETCVFKISQTIAVQHDGFYYPFNACDAIPKFDKTDGDPEPEINVCEDEKVLYDIETKTTNKNCSV